MPIPSFQLLGSRNSFKPHNDIMLIYEMQLKKFIKFIV